PMLPRRRSPPGATHPEIILSFVVVSPVSADPDHIAFRLLSWWHLFQRRWGFLGDGLSRNGLGSGGSERLMDRPTRHHFDSLGGRKRLLILREGRRRRFLRGDGLLSPKRGQHEDHKKKDANPFYVHHEMAP